MNWIEKKYNSNMGALRKMIFVHFKFVSRWDSLITTNINLISITSWPDIVIYKLLWPINGPLNESNFE